MTHLGLADAVNPSEALLQAVRVPGQVVVHHQVRALQIDTFAGRVGGEQHLDLRVVAEGFLSLEPILAAHAAVNRHDGSLASQQRRDPVVQIAQRIAVLGEDDQLLMRSGNSGVASNLSRFSFTMRRIRSETSATCTPSRKRPSNRSPSMSAMKS